MKTETPITPLAAECWQIGVEAAHTVAIEAVADYIGAQDDGNGGKFELYNLRQQLGKFPRGTTLARGTIEAALFPRDAA